jgi:hypothetical protein
MICHLLYFGKKWNDGDSVSFRKEYQALAVGTPLIIVLFFISHLLDIEKVSDRLAGKHSLNYIIIYE